MRYHKAHLTRRLILDISADSEIEENMVEWLRVSNLTSLIFLQLCLFLAVLIPTLELRYPSCLGEFYLKLRPLGTTCARVLLQYLVTVKQLSSFPREIFILIVVAIHFKIFLV